MSGAFTMVISVNEPPSSMSQSCNKPMSENPTRHFERLMRMMRKNLSVLRKPFLI
jgi:hypothetical protein